MQCSEQNIIYNSQMAETTQMSVNLMNGLTKCGIFTQWNIIWPQKRTNYCYVLHMEESWKQHTKWKMPNTTDPVLHNFIFYFNFLLYKWPFTVYNRKWKRRRYNSSGSWGSSTYSVTTLKKPFSFFMKCPEQGKSTETESRLMDARGWGDRGMKVT